MQFPYPVTPKASNTVFTASRDNVKNSASLLVVSLGMHLVGVTSSLMWKTGGKAAQFTRRGE